MDNIEQQWQKRHNQAADAFYQGNLPKAEKLLNECVTIAEKAGQHGIFMTINTLHTLAVVLREQDKLDAAVECQKKSVATVKQLQPPDDQAVVAVQGNAASFLQESECHKEAIAIFGDAITLAEKHEQWTVAADLMLNRTMSMEQLDDLDGVIDGLRKSAEYAKRGDDQQLVGVALHRLMTVSGGSGRLDGLQPFVEELLGEYEPGECAEMGLARNSHATLLLHEGRPLEALDELDAAEAIFLATLERLEAGDSDEHHHHDHGEGCGCGHDDGAIDEDEEGGLNTEEGQAVLSMQLCVNRAQQAMLYALKYEHDGEEGSRAMCLAKIDDARETLESVEDEVASAGVLRLLAEAQDKVGR